MKEKVVSFVVIATVLVVGLFGFASDLAERSEQIFEEHMEARERITATYDDAWEQMGKIVAMKMVSSGN